MTAICGGGDSGPQLTADAVLTYGAGRLAQLLLQAGLSEFSAALPLVGVIPVVLSSFCSTDPPAMTALTTDEAQALLNLTFNTDFFNGLAKLKDMLLNAIWDDVCQCNTGIYTPPVLPAAPTDTPVFVPPSTAPTPPVAQGWYPMLRADVKVLALGCGSPARPTGWTLPEFNDSAWTTPAVAPTSVAAVNWSTVGGAQLGAAVGANASLPGAVEFCAPADPMPHNCEQFLIRWKVFIGDVTPKFAAVRWTSAWVSGGGWSSGIDYANGTQAVHSNVIGEQTLANALIPNAWNIICLDINSSNAGSADTWGAHGGVAFGLDFTSATAKQYVTPCCPPDPITQTTLDAILGMVTLIQRQVAPFAYIVGASHTGLTATGELAVNGLLGAKITITSSLPSNIGSAAANPVHLFGAGWVQWGSADGYGPRIWLDQADTLSLPGGAGAYTLLAYSLPPGLTIRVDELVREP